ncbi:MAG TPA: alanine--tRNA ligase [Candidatus Nitrosotalea sp.]|nr:alanine--tRNA ligase [Candidatus Nitrosotalea sp.]
MTGSEIRRRFLEYFRNREHEILQSASLVPVDDPTTLFISAGMQPLQPFYLGLKQLPSPRLVSCQRCLRVGDLEQVGRTDRHQTLFEMLGNFAPSGGYFKEHAIPWAYEFLTDAEHGLGLDPARLAVTTHPSDEESRAIWRERTGLPERALHQSADNWWGLEFGPCGPDSEIWWDRGPDAGCGEEGCVPDHCPRFLEIWNLVFPQFDRQATGELAPLPRPAIDTGMGLERVAAVVQGVDDSFGTDLFLPLIEFTREHSSRPLQLSERVIADHLRAAVFVIGDGVMPANEGRGYVLRRLIRRAAYHARRAQLSRPLAEGVGLVVDLMQDQYPHLSLRRALIEETVEAESRRFASTLAQGMEIFESLAGGDGRIAGDDAFRLHDTFGFPLALTRELAEERGGSVDEAGFAAAMDRQRERSRAQTRQGWAPDLRSLPRCRFTGYDTETTATRVSALRREGVAVSSASEGDELEVYLQESPFYAESGGQVGDRGRIVGPSGEFWVEDTQRPIEGIIAHLGRVGVGGIAVGEEVSARVDAPRRRQIMRHHSATHLLNRALELVSGGTNLQRGSFVGPDRATFDFALDRALEADEMVDLGRQINAQIRSALARRVQELPLEEAMRTGATHLFEERYGDLVRVVSFGSFSSEFCGGTHVENSADVGPVVLTAQSSVGAGVRRIEFLAGLAAEEFIERRLRIAAETARDLGVPAERARERVSELRAEVRALERQIAQLVEQNRSARLAEPGHAQRRAARVPLIMEEVPASGIDDLRGWADRYLEVLGGHGVVAVANSDNFVIKVSRDLSQDVSAERLGRVLGRGGGRPEMAQGRLERGLREAFAALQEELA